MSTIARTFKRVRSIMLLFSLALFTLPVTATDFITDVMLIGAGNKQDLESLKSKYSSQGWKILDKDFNAGIDWGKGDGILLLYKTATSTDGYNHGYITDLYLQNRSAANTTNTLNFNGRTYNLVPFDGSSHFKDVKGDLNSGTGSSTDAIHLYYTKEHFADNRAITTIFINGNSGGAVGREGNTKSGYNLNAGCSKGENIFLHASTATAPFQDCYFTDVMLIGAGSSSELESVKATYTSQGWKVIDYDLNKGIDWGKGEAIYLLYKAEISPDGLNHNYITDFYLQNRSAANTTDTLTFRGYTYQIVPYEGSQHFKNVKGDLNSGTGDNSDPIHLYYTRRRDLTNGSTLTGIFFNDHSADLETVWKEGDKYPYDLNSGCNGLTSEKIYMHYTFASTWKGLFPKGELEVCELQGRAVHIKGWVYDPDESNESIVVNIEIIGNAQHKYLFGGHTTILNETLNMTEGISGKHGFDWIIPRKLSDTYSIRVFAYDITGDIDSIQIGSTRKLTLTGNTPKSALESFESNARSISIRGWAYDPDVQDEQIDVHLTIKNITSNSTYKSLYLKADQERSDINFKYGINGNHGFSSTIAIDDAPAGTYTVTTYAIDNTGDGDTQIGEPHTFIKTHTKPSSELERIEVIDDTLIVQGWAYDPDDRNDAIPIRVEFRNTDGSLYDTWNLNATNIVRDDINSQFNISGAHGFMNRFAFDQDHTFNVSIYACDITGDGETQIGTTQTVTVRQTSYKLWVGGTQVTRNNLYNILDKTDENGVPTAWFEPTTNTLTLNEPIMYHYYDGSLIYADGINIVIKGRFHFTKEGATTNAIYVKNGDLTLDGNFKLYGGKIGITTGGGTVVIKGDSVICEGGLIGLACYDFIISGNAQYVELTGRDFAVNGKIKTPGHNISTPSGAIINGYYIYESDGATYAKHVIFNKKNEPYKVWIGGKQVTSDIWDDVFGDGKVSFDPETNTLTLNNPTIDGYHTIGGSQSSVIYTEVGNLSVNGTFRQSESTAQYCIATACGNLSITGDFALPGIIAGVSCDTLKILNGTTHLTLTGGDKASESTDITLGDWLNPITPDKKIINGKFYESDGSTLAKQVELTGYETDYYFDLWLGDTQVSRLNKDNILNQTDDNGEPTAVYDPYSSTLTLNYPIINGTFGGSKIYSDIRNLTIKGDYHMTTAESDFGFLSDNNYDEPCVFDGNFTFLGTRYGIYVVQNATAKSGTLKAVGTSKNGLLARKLNVKSDITKIHLEGGESAILLSRYGTLKCEAFVGLSTPLHGIQKEVPGYSINTIFEEDGTTIAHKIIIEPGYKEYDFWVGTEHVTVNNYTDILGDGKVSFNPDNNTLTLNRPVITGCHVLDDNSTATIFAKQMDLTIKGEYIMSQANADFGVLVSQGKLTLDGDFTLYGNMCGASASANLSGIGEYIEGNEIFDMTLCGNIKLFGGKYGLNSAGKTNLNGTLFIKGNYTGLFSNGDINIGEDAYVTIEAKINRGIECRFDALIINGGVKGVKINRVINVGNLNIYNGYGQNTQIIIPQKGYYDSKYHTVMIDDIIADSIVIGTPYNLYVGKVPVSSVNKDDILGDGGKVRFDPDAKTLYMDSPEITDYLIDTNNSTAVIYAYDTDLTIKGEYHMTESGVDYGFILRFGNLTLEGDYTLYGNNVALGCPDGTLTIKGGRTSGIILRGKQGLKTLMMKSLVLKDNMVIKKPSHYIVVPNIMTIWDLDSESVPSSIIINRIGAPDYPDPTMIQTIESQNDNNKTDLWFDMYGRKLDGIPTEKGLYIYNGKAVYLAQ